MSETGLSVVIPTLNAAESLPRALVPLSEARQAGLIGEILVADGGSSDRTRTLAVEAGAEVIAAPRGRGPQLLAGAAAASGDWLLFLHADTILSKGWHRSVRGFINDADNQNRAAVFRLVLDDDAAGARRVERLARWRSRVLGLPYGDQALLISAKFYRELGGFKPLPLMEDVDLVRRVGRRRIVTLDASALTSAVRYRRGGWWLRPLRNLVTLTLYFLGVPPAMLKRFYG